MDVLRTLALLFLWGTSATLQAGRDDQERAPLHTRPTTSPVSCPSSQDKPSDLPPHTYVTLGPRGNFLVEGKPLSTVLDPLIFLENCFGFDPPSPDEAVFLLSPPFQIVPVTVPDTSPPPKSTLSITSSSAPQTLSTTALSSPLSHFKIPELPPSVPQLMSPVHTTQTLFTPALLPSTLQPPIFLQNTAHSVDEGLTYAREGHLDHAIACFETVRVIYHKPVKGHRFSAKEIYARALNEERLGALYKARFLKSAVASDYEKALKVYCYFLNETNMPIHHQGYFLYERLELYSERFKKDPLLLNDDIKCAELHYKDYDLFLLRRFLHFAIPVYTFMEQYYVRSPSQQESYSRKLPEAKALLHRVDACLDQVPETPENSILLEHKRLQGLGRF